MIVVFKIAEAWLLLKRPGGRDLVATHPSLRVYFIVSIGYKPNAPISEAYLYWFAVSNPGGRHVTRAVA